MADRAAFDREAATLGTRTFGGIEHFLVGQHGAEVGAKPNRLLFDIGEALLKQLHEDPLCPLKIAGVGGVDFTLPVVSEAELTQLFFKASDVLFGGLARVLAGFDGILLGRQTKRIPAHWVEHVKPLCFFEAFQRITCSVTFRMADMQSSTGRIRKHVEDVERGFVLEILRAVGCLCLPEILPLGLDRGKVVVFGLYSHFNKTANLEGSRAVRQCCKERSSDPSSRAVK